MIRFAPSLFAGCIVAFGLLAASNGVAEIQNKDRTGAPGSANPCSQCHNGGSGTVDVEIQLVNPVNNLVVNAYLPGESYVMRMVVTSDFANEYGAQGTAILADGTNAGAFSTPSGNTQLESVEGRHIIEHNSSSTDNVFEATWVAPETGSGTVSFYMSGVGADGAGSFQNDGYAGTSLDIEEAIVIGVADVVSEAWKAPTRCANQWQFAAPMSGRLVVTDLAGRTLHSLCASEGQALTWDLSGIQVVHFAAQGGSHRTWKLAGF